jgi:predicted ArsR family transcriptional regulator
MKQTINLYDFRRAFESIRPDNFSYEGLEVLFDSFEQLEQDTGNDMELDVIGVCCEFQESTVDEVIDGYMDQMSDAVSDEDKTEIVTEYLHDNTFFVGETSTGKLLFQSF